jgi:predicted transcriptional regulator
MFENDKELVDLSAMIVAAYVAHNNVTRSDLVGLIESTHSALARLGSEPAAQPEQPLVPAVSIKKSITPDYLICLDDGKKFKSLKRHLRTQYDMTPEQYRSKWGLPPDYPMVAPAYAEARSVLARSMGLGRKAAAVPAATPAPPIKPKRAKKAKA